MDPAVEWLGGVKIEAFLGMIAAIVGVAGVILIAAGPERERGEAPLRRGWTIGLILIGLAFFWFGSIGVLD